MTKSRKKKATSRTWRLSLLVFLATGAVVVVERQDLLRGLKGYLFDRFDLLRIENPSDLPGQRGARARPAVVIGIPDYKNEVRIPYEGKNLTCYRVLGFENRLCVCTTKGLRAPEAIEEVIQDHRVRGHLQGLAGTPLGDRTRSVFEKTVKIDLKENAFLLLEDSSPLPSPVQFGALAFCLLLCCLSAYRLIKK